jgi:hypothetical protein
MSQVANKMSNNNYSNNAKKPFCKVCFDAGKADTAHFIRKTPDPKSQVTCPTLLALECRYCLQHGHTVKYCTVLQKQDKADNKNKRVIFNTPNPTPTTTKNSNKFAVFEDEDDLEQLQRLQQQQICEQRILQFPKLATQTLTNQTLDNLQFPKLATQTLTNQTLDNLQFPKLATQTLSTQTTINQHTTNKWAAMASVAANKPIPITIIKPITIIQQTNTKWADDDDDEDEDDDNLSFADEHEYAPTAYTYAPVANTYTHYSANDDDW